MFSNEKIFKKRIENMNLRENCEMQPWEIGILL